MKKGKITKKIVPSCWGRGRAQEISLFLGGQENMKIFEIEMAARKFVPPSPQGGVPPPNTPTPGSSGIEKQRMGRLKRVLV